MFFYQVFHQSLANTETIGQHISTVLHVEACASGAPLESQLPSWTLLEGHHRSHDSNTKAQRPSKPVPQVRAESPSHHIGRIFVKHEGQIKPIACFIQGCRDRQSWECADHLENATIAALEVA